MLEIITGCGILRFKGFGLIQQRFKGCGNYCSSSEDMSSTIWQGKGEKVMKELIQYIAQALVDHSDQVEVKEIKAQQTLVLELRVAKEDLGKVIGKKGRTAQAMRTILSCASAKEQKRVILEIVE